MVNGWVILDKPHGMGSTQAVAAVKRNLRQAGFGKVKVGHGGTLDPLATGVLPIGVGEATKLCGRMLDASKSYAFTVAFGSETDTLDLEGVTTVQGGLCPSLPLLKASLPPFCGPIEQVPPAYSAIMVDGQRAYDRARAGQEVELKSRNVTIHDLSILETEGPEEALQFATLVAHVSKGTYIRSLARDIAHALGTVGHVTYLRRIKAGPFDLSHAISLDKLTESANARRLEQILLPLRAGLDDIPALSLDPDQAGALRQGRVLVGIAEDDGLHFAMLGETPVALVEVESGEARIVRGFNC